jgi:hypothetical protein
VTPSHSHCYTFASALTSTSVGVPVRGWSSGPRITGRAAGVGLWAYSGGGQRGGVSSGSPPGQSGHWRL